jgi:hypothetical protein
MGARFVGVSLRRSTVNWSWCVAAATAFSCSVFPDEATLPNAAAGAPVGGGSVIPVGGAGGEGADSTALGGVGATGAGTTSVAGGGAEGGGSPLGVGGAADGGAGGAVACVAPLQHVITVTADSWIEFAKPATTHGNDAMLSVVGGGQERRALLEVTLPAATAGAVLLKASFVLHLQANADVGLARRQLRLHRLAQQVVEGRASWNKFDNGSKGTWITPGGDFGPAIAQGPVPAGTADGTLTFNVTAAVRNAFAATPVPLSLILLETSAPPPAPAELAFTSSEGDASGIPALILEYCEP